MPPVLRKGAADPGENIVRDLDALQYLAQFLRNLFLAEAWKLSFSVVSATAVVHVFALFELRSHREIIVRTREHAPKRDVFYEVDFNIELFEAYRVFKVLYYSAIETCSEARAS